MLFSSIPFLYYFLPVVMLCYFLAPRGLKNTVLLLFSLVFYAWGEPKYVLLMLCTIAVFYLCGLAIERAGTKRWKKLWLWLSVAVGIGFLAVFKYADFFIHSFREATGLSLPLLRLALPVGISFYTFQCISYTVDVYRGNVPAQRNVISFGAYVTLFPQLIAGPIVRYADVAKALDSRTHSWENVTCGARRFLLGLGKKILIADQFALLIQLFRESPEKSVLFYWLYAVAFMLNIYFDFSGYSDMAIGLGRIFGFRFGENFNYPYISRSITEFWRRWHISLGGWFRDYVYIPMGGNRVGKGRCPKPNIATRSLPAWERLSALNSTKLIHTISSTYRCLINPGILCKTGIHFSKSSITANKSPHRTKFQAAPCHRPVSIQTVRIFSIQRPFPTRLPPIGIYT